MKEIRDIIVVLGQLLILSEQHANDPRLAFVSVNILLRVG
jgi:hypothetical protein